MRKRGESVERTRTSSPASVVRASSPIVNRLLSVAVIVAIVAAIVVVGVVNRQGSHRIQVGSGGAGGATQVAVPPTDPRLATDRPPVGKPLSGPATVTSGTAGSGLDPSDPAPSLPGARGSSTSAPTSSTSDPSGDDVGHRPDPDIPVVADGPLTNVPAGWAATTHDLTAGNLPRSYLMVRPPVKLGTSLPVVVILHGRGMTPTIMERISHVLPVIGRAIAVFPAGWGRSWNAGGCCGVAHRAGIDDVAFLSDVVHQVLSTQSDASAHRVYLVGYSNGGRMAMRMVCADPGMFAGLAAVEAVPVAQCASTVPLPTVLLDSTGDPLLTIPTDGAKKTMQGYVEPTVGETVDEWRALDGCEASAASSTTGLLTSTAWSSCRGAGRVSYDLYQGGSHHWPLGGAATPSAESLISRFLFGPGPTAAST